MSGPFSLFPEEVWEIILDGVTDSKDAWNLFRTFPELDMNAGLQKKKHIWLFGLVLPHLIPSIKVNWIKEEDLLNCRLVSNRWSAFVDNFLETQNQLRAYHFFRPEPQVLGGFYWDTQDYYLERIEVGVGAGRLFFWGNHIIGGTYICDGHMDNLTITRFLHEFEGHPQERNPFLGRFLSLNVYLDGGRLPGILWNNNATFNLLDRFGKHIWYYQVHFGGNDLEPWYMARCLGLLPNLRSLHLKGMLNHRDEPLSEEELAPFLMPGRGSLPHLPYLETLRIENYNNYKSGTFLIRRYSGQIRRLEVGISLWKPEYSHIFPNLAELELTYIHPDPSHSNKLNELLLSIQAPFLSKLVLKSEFFGPEEEEFCSGTLGIEADIFPWLKRFPNIQYLNLGDEYWIARCLEEGTLSPEKDSIPSLKFLSIRTSTKMSYNFLRCLPSLQYLHLHVHPEPIVIDLSEQFPPPQVKILDEIQTAKMYRSNIWELLPKLRTVTLLPECYFDGTYYTFSREGYESELKQRNLSSPPSDEVAVPLRPDIIQFLRERKQSDRESDPDLYYGWDEDSDWDTDDSSNY